MNAVEAKRVTFHCSVCKQKKCDIKNGGSFHDVDTKCNCAEEALQQETSKDIT